MRWVRRAATLGAGVVLGLLLARLVPEAPGGAAAPAAAQPAVAAAAPERPTRAPIALPPAAPASAGTRSLADILRIDSDFEQTAALYDLVRHADVEQLETLIDETDTVPGLTDRRAALSILYGRYADLAPQAAVDYLLAHGGTFKQVELTAVFHAWARSDLPAALARAAELEPSLRQVAARAVLLSRDGLPPARQREVAEQLGADGVLPQIAMQQAMNLTTTNPFEAWRSAVSNPDGNSRRQQLQAVAATWARADPVAALNAVTALEDAQLRGRLQAMVVNEWSRQYPRDAVNWALAQPASDHRRNLVAQALGGVAENDPRMAVDMARELSGGDRREAMHRVFAQWAMQDPSAAAASLDLLTQPQVRGRVVTTIASHFARRDAESALAWVATLDPAESANASQIVISRLARNDPQRASRLVSRLPGGSGRQQATQALVMHWARQDRDAALRYLEGLGSGPEREAAIVGAISSQQFDPDIAESLYSELRDDGRRKQAARSLYQALSRGEAQRAERYLEAAGLRQ